MQRNRRWRLACALGDIVMNVGIVGSGMIGGTLARICTRAGHQVSIANRRGPGSLPELVAEAFNTIYFRDLATQGRDAPLAQRRAIFLAGDDADAKALVTQLIESIGFGAVDTGALREGGRQQQLGSELFNVQLSVAAAEAALHAG